MPSSVQNNRTTVRSSTMEVYLSQVKDVCNHLLPEEALSNRIVRNARQLFVADALQRIQEAVFPSLVWKELMYSASSLACPRTCSAALLKLQQLAPQQNAGPSSGLTDSYMTATRAADLVLTCMSNHDTIPEIQQHGCSILDLLTRKNDRDEDLLSLLSSARDIDAVCLALKSFPNNPRVQSSAFGVLVRIHRACLLTEDEHFPTFYRNLIHANALPLSVAALQQHPADTSVAHGALIVLRFLAQSDELHPPTQAAFLNFVQAFHPDGNGASHLRTILANVVRTQRRQQRQQQQQPLGADDAVEQVVHEATLICLLFLVTLTRPVRPHGDDDDDDVREHAA